MSYHTNFIPNWLSLILSHFPRGRQSQIFRNGRQPWRLFATEEVANWRKKKLILNSTQICCVLKVDWIGMLHRHEWYNLLPHLIIYLCLARKKVGTRIILTKCVHAYVFVFIDSFVKVNGRRQRCTYLPSPLGNHYQSCERQLRSQTKKGDMPFSLDWKFLFGRTYRNCKCEF